jgi:hypothetical protein
MAIGFSRVTGMPALWLMETKKPQPHRVAAFADWCQAFSARLIR